MRTTFLRLGFGLLLLAGLGQALSSCQPTDVRPSGKRGGCGTSTTPADTTTTGGNS